MNWYVIEKIGWFIVGIGCTNMGWVGDHPFLDMPWGNVALGGVTVIAAWFFQPRKRTS